MYDKQCQLCHKMKELQNSHIIPKFVLNYLKTSSVTGKIRMGKNVNMRVQDGEKHYLFCRDCEQLMGTYEKEIAEQIFLPLHQDNALDFNYDINLFKFISIQTYRTILADEITNTNNQTKNPSLKKKLLKAKEFLRNNIVMKYNGHNEYNYYLFRYNLIDNLEDSVIKKNQGINRYFMRAIDRGVIYNSNRLIVFSKLYLLLILCFIVPKKTKLLSGTRVYKNGSLFGVQNMDFPGLTKYFMNRANQNFMLHEKMSDKQKKIIHNEFIKNEGTKNHQFNNLIQSIDEQMLEE